MLIELSPLFYKLFVLLLSLSESVLLHLWHAAAALPYDHPCDRSDHGLENEGL